MRDAHRKNGVVEMEALPLFLLTTISNRNIKLSNQTKTKKKQKIND